MGELNVSHHPGFVVSRNVAGEFKRGVVWEFPDEFSRLARLQQDAVAFFVHAVPYDFLHVFGGFPINAVRLKHAMLDHHFHFRGVRFVHRGSSDVEFVNELALIGDDETDGLLFLQIQRFRLKIVVVHLDGYGPGDISRLAGLTDLVRAMAMAMPALGKARQRRCEQGNADGDGCRQRKDRITHGI